MKAKVVELTSRLDSTDHGDGRAETAEEGDERRWCRAERRRRRRRWTKRTEADDVEPRTDEDSRRWKQAAAVITNDKQFSDDKTF